MRRRFKTRYLSVDWKDATNFQRFMFVLTWIGVLAFIGLGMWAALDERYLLMALSMILCWVSALWPCYTGDRKRRQNNET